MKLYFFHFILLFFRFFSFVCLLVLFRGDYPHSPPSFRKCFPIKWPNSCACKSSLCIYECSWDSKITHKVIDIVISGQIFNVTCHTTLYMQWYHFKSYTETRGLCVHTKSVGSIVGAESESGSVKLSLGEIQLYVKEERAKAAAANYRPGFS